MIEQKKYMDIERLKPAFIDGFEVGDKIIIQEKIDGANFSIRYDSETNTIRAFSRRKELDCQNNLRGAYEWSQNLAIEKIKRVLGTNLVLFGEWLIPHSVSYPKERYKNMYCFDVYDVKTKQYLPQDKVKDIVDELGLIYVPVFYEGEFISWEHIKSFVGKTQLGGEYGEGCVIKNETKLNNPNTRLPFYVKLVCEQFCETKAHKDSKPVDANKIAEREKKQNLTSTIVTKARVQKLLHKMVDEGILKEDWSAKDMGTVAKNLGREIYNDCKREEPEIVSEVGSDFGKFAASTAMRLAREILSEKEEV